MTKKISPAKQASETALKELRGCIDKKKCFKLEAGAGAGKTFSLIEALKYVLKKEYSFLNANSQVACITYTNVAKKEIDDRIDNNPLIFTDTIHAFSWSAIKPFQKQMREYLPELGGKWKKRIEKYEGELKNQKVVYDSGYPSINDDEINLYHDDVIKYMSHLLEFKKYQSILKSRFPIIFIDEYQDMNIGLAESIVSQLIDNDSGILIGFFGDHWQKIYHSKDVSELIKHSEDKIHSIDLNANFRSNKTIVDVLNRMRPELPQEINNTESQGEVLVLHSNGHEHSEEVTKGNHREEDLSPEEKSEYLNKIRKHLYKKGWETDSTKILMLTHKTLAQEQGYTNIHEVFENNDDYTKPNDPYIKFFLDVLEPVCKYYKEKKYGEIFKLLGDKRPLWRNQGHKKKWHADLNDVMQLRKEGTIDKVIKGLQKTKCLRLSSGVEKREAFYQGFGKLDDAIKKEKQLIFNEAQKLKIVSYSEVIKLFKYAKEQTPFSTKHGVKGQEFENVLALFGEEWNWYDWNEMLSWVYDSTTNLTEKQKEKRKLKFKRNRNLFYVVCSRPKKRLALFFSQYLEDAALDTLTKWFGEENISDVTTTPHLKITKSPQ